MVGAVPQQLAQAVAKTLMGLVGRRHAMCLIYDHQIPMDLSQTGEDIGTLGQIQRCDDPLALEPLVRGARLDRRRPAGPRLVD